MYLTLWPAANSLSSSSGGKCALHSSISHFSVLLFLVLSSPCTAWCFTWCVWCRCVSQPCRCWRGGPSPYGTAIHWTQSTSMGEFSSCCSICVLLCATGYLYILILIKTTDCTVVRKGICRWIKSQGCFITGKPVCFFRGVSSLWLY